MNIHCTQCGQPYPAEGTPYRCANCGGFFDWDGPPKIDLANMENDQPGIWKYRHSFGLDEGSPVVSLGEGNTPLVWEKAFGTDVGLKLEFLNPTGSFKDRGTAVLLSHLLNRGVTYAVEDSSGNAGASFSGYAARAHIRAKVFVPDVASGPKRRQIEMYGAELVAVPGPRSAAAEAVRQEADGGAAYASHAYLPFGLPGLATIAYELFIQAGGVPGTIITPMGQGNLIHALMRGFAGLKQAGTIQQPPVFVGVQARACAPIWAAFNGTPNDVREDPTAAEGIRVRYPASKDSVLAEMTPGRDQVVVVEEEQILPARDELARRGVYVEPTSAVTWAALKQLAGQVPGPIVLVLTGFGLKFYN